MLERLAAAGICLVVLRSAGFNNVDLTAARRLGITVARVPGYSPEAVAEHTIAMMLALNRNIHRAYVRVREGNFALDGLLGFDINRRTVGIVGTGKIGTAVARIMKGFGCRTVAYDPFVNEECVALGVQYLPLNELLATAHIITLHCPLTPDQAFFTVEALTAIAEVTLENLDSFERSGRAKYEVSVEKLA